MHRISLLLLTVLGLPVAVGLLPAAGPSPERAELAEPVHTFSIVAYDPERKEWGVGVASRYLAVGAVVPWARANVGAVATQATVNITWGPEGLKLLEQGKCAEEVVKTLIAVDKRSKSRQIGVIDAKGNAASYTGPSCGKYAGHKTGKHYACQGNLLAGEPVVAEMAKAFEASKGPLAWRIMAALEAGEKAGGDKRGKQSAAIVVVREKSGPNGLGDRMIDLRVDDHKEPIPELARILDLRLRRPKVALAEKE